MRIEPTPMAGLWQLRGEPRHDARGSFQRLFDAAALAEVAPGFGVRQVNHSLTRQRGTVRGLHLQWPAAGEWKLVRCLNGAVFDVAVDLRPGSPTFGRWHALELDAQAGHALLIPPGVAHGFQALRNDVQLLYHHGADYQPALEAGVRHDDPALAIAWPLPVTMLSERDRRLPGLAAFAEALCA